MLVFRGVFVVLNLSNTFSHTVTIIFEFNQNSMSCSIIEYSILGKKNGKFTGEDDLKGSKDSVTYSANGP